VKNIRVASFILIFLCCCVTAFAVKAKDIPPWMEDIEESGRSTYLVPKGAIRKVIGSQVIVEAPNEYVARRLYEMEAYLQARFKTIEENQEKLQKELDDLKKGVGELQSDNTFDQDLDDLRVIVEELNAFTRKMEESTRDQEFVEKSGEKEEIVEEPVDLEEPPRKKPETPQSENSNLQK